MSVEDDGLGLPEGGIVDGVGLGTTRERLRMQFEDSASLEMQSRPGGGTRVRLRLPFRVHAEGVAA